MSIGERLSRSKMDAATNLVLPRRILRGAPPCYGLSVPENFTTLLLSATTSLGYSGLLVMVFWVSGQIWVRSNSLLLANLLMAPAATVITTVIRNDIALSLGMVGALSIVRFRNPVRNPAELALYFGSLVIGIAATINLTFPVVLILVAILAVALAQVTTRLLNSLGKPFSSWENGGYLLSASSIQLNPNDLLGQNFQVVHIGGLQSSLDIVIRCKDLKDALLAKEELSRLGTSSPDEWTITEAV